MPIFLSFKNQPSSALFYQIQQAAIAKGLSGDIVHESPKDGSNPFVVDATSEQLVALLDLFKQLFGSVPVLTEEAFCYLMTFFITNKCTSLESLKPHLILLNPSASENESLMLHIVSSLNCSNTIDGPILAGLMSHLIEQSWFRDFIMRHRDTLFEKNPAFFDRSDVLILISVGDKFMVKSFPSASKNLVALPADLERFYINCRYLDRLEILFPKFQSNVMLFSTILLDPKFLESFFNLVQLPDAFYPTSLLTVWSSDPKGRQLIENLLTNPYLYDAEKGEMFKHRFVGFPDFVSLLTKPFQTSPENFSTPLHGLSLSMTCLHMIFSARAYSEAERTLFATLIFSKLGIGILENIIHFSPTTKEEWMAKESVSSFLAVLEKHKPTFPMLSVETCLFDPTPLLDSKNLRKFARFFETDPNSWELLRNSRLFMHNMTSFLLTTWLKNDHLRPRAIEMAPSLLKDYRDQLFNWLLAPFVPDQSNLSVICLDGRFSGFKKALQGSLATLVTPNNTERIWDVLLRIRVEGKQPRCFLGDLMRHAAVLTEPADFVLPDLFSESNCNQLATFWGPKKPTEEFLSLLRSPERSLAFFRLESLKMAKPVLDVVLPLCVEQLMGTEFRFNTHPERDLWYQLFKTGSFEDRYQSSPFEQNPLPLLTHCCDSLLLSSRPEDKELLLKILNHPYLAKIMQSSNGKTINKLQKFLTSSEVPKESPVPSAPVVIAEEVLTFFKSLQTKTLPEMNASHTQMLEDFLTNSKRKNKLKGLLSLTDECLYDLARLILDIHQLLKKEQPSPQSEHGLVDLIKNQDDPWICSPLVELIVKHHQQSAQPVQEPILKWLLRLLAKNGDVQRLGEIVDLNLIDRSVDPYLLFESVLDEVVSKKQKGDLSKELVSLRFRKKAGAPKPLQVDNTLLLQTRINEYKMTLPMPLPRATIPETPISVSKDSLMSAFQTANLQLFVMSFLKRLNKSSVLALVGSQVPAFLEKGQFLTEADFDMEAFILLAPSMTTTAMQQQKLAHQFLLDLVSQVPELKDIKIQRQGVLEENISWCMTRVSVGDWPIDVRFVFATDLEHAISRTRQARVLSNKASMIRINTPKCARDKESDFIKPLCYSDNEINLIKPFDQLTLSNLGYIVSVLYFTENPKINPDFMRLLQCLFDSPRLINELKPICSELVTKKNASRGIYLADLTEDSILYDVSKKLGRPVERATPRQAKGSSHRLRIFDPKAAGKSPPTEPHPAQFGPKG